MKNVDTLNFAFVFRSLIDQSQVAIWAHQELLLSTAASKLTKVLSLPNRLDSTSPERRYKIVFLEMPFNMLDAYCILICFLYTGKLEHEIDLCQFCVSPRVSLSPDKQVLIHTDFVDDLLAEPLMKALWRMVFHLALTFEMKELQAHCEQYSFFGRSFVLGDSQ